VYVPAHDVDAAAARYVDLLDAELLWKVRAMGTTVAALRVSSSGPCAVLRLGDGERYAVYELTRPHVEEHFRGRFDE
jgi:hypothetical protein